MIPFDERLKHIFEALNTTPYKFSGDHGLNRMSIYNILNGKTKPSSELLERICDSEPRISAEFLLRGQGEPLRDLKSQGGMETLRTLLELQSTVNQFIETKAKALQD